MGSSISFSAVASMRAGEGSGLNVSDTCFAALCAAVALANVVFLAASLVELCARLSSDPCKVSRAPTQVWFCGAMYFSTFVGGTTACTGWKGLATSGTSTAVFCEASQKSSSSGD